MGHPYSYKPGPSRLGIGVSNLAFERPQTFPTVHPWQYPVHRTLRALEGANIQPAAVFTPISLVGNGAGLVALLELQRLSKASSGN